MGVWGNVPDDFRRYMFQQTVAAIVDAWQHRQPANLFYGYSPARDLQSNQFDYDASNKVMDSDVRVLQARRSDDKPIATILDFSSHPTVLGGGNQHITGDWPTQANELMAKRYGGGVMTIVGTLGRTQPADRGCSDKAAKGDKLYLCTEKDYASRVVKRTVDAVHAAKRLSGPPVVDGRSYLVQDAAQNAAILGFNVAGDPAGIPLNRSTSPPWLTGNVIGSVTGSLRIGDVLMSVIPGEAYPQIPLGVRALVPGLRGYMTAGLAGDQLGYLIAPYEAFAEPIRRTLFNERGDQVSPLDNDNYAFNVSMTIGTHIQCSLLRGAGELWGKGTQYRDANSRCVMFPGDLVTSSGGDAGGGRGARPAASAPLEPPALLDVAVLLQVVRGHLRRVLLVDVDARVEL
jgi:hypothetical protein